MFPIKAIIRKNKFLQRWEVYLPIGSSGYTKHRFIRFENAIWYAQHEMEKGSIFSGVSDQEN